MTYLEVCRDLEGLFLDAAETRRSDLSRAVEVALAAVPRVERLWGTLGPVARREPDLDGYELLQQRGRSQEELLKMASSALAGMPRWHSPAVMHNVNPAPMLGTVALSALANLYNPNTLWDFVSAGVHEYERQIIRQLAGEAAWPKSNAAGAFTFGGKACLTYAIRIGLNRCLAEYSRVGRVAGHAPVVIATATNHYSIASACSLLGLGTEAWIQVPAMADQTIDLEAFDALVARLAAEERPIACVIASGGNTLDMVVDPVAEMRTVIDRHFVDEDVLHRPFLYFDTVVGWPWLFFADYDWGENHLAVPESLIAQFKRLGGSLGQIAHSDGFGVDFHKTGFAPYVTSLFLVKDGRELQGAFRDGVAAKQPFGNNFMQHHTIEHSRSAAPVLSAWFALQAAGRDGFRSYLVRLTEIGRELSSRLSLTGFRQVNDGGGAFSGVFWVPGPDGPPTYSELLKSDLAVVEASNRRHYAIFDSLADPADGSAPLVLRYLPQYQVAGCGAPAGTLVAYPMALETSAADIETIASRISAAANRVLGLSQDGFNFRFQPPQHVPK